MPGPLARQGLGLPEDVVEKMLDELDFELPGEALAEETL
jgi:hypothetical protein